METGRKPRKPRITEEQFLVDAINKEYELVGADKHFESFEELKAYGDEHHDWYQEYEFPTEELHKQWKAYIREHYKQIHGKSHYYVRDSQLAWFSLQYGFPVAEK